MVYRRQKDEWMRVSPDFKGLVSSFKNDAQTSSKDKKISDRLITQGLFRFLEEENLSPIVKRRLKRPRGGGLL